MGWSAHMHKHVDTHTHTRLLAWRALTHTHTLIWSIPLSSARIIYSAARLQMKRLSGSDWIWYELIRLKQEGRWIHFCYVCVCVTICRIFHIKPFFFYISWSLQTLVPLPDRRRTDSSKLQLTRKHHDAGCSAVSCSADPLEPISVLTSWCISHVLLITLMFTHTQKSWLLYHLGQFFLTVSSTQLFTSSIFAEQRTDVVHSGACGKVHYLSLKGFVQQNPKTCSILTCRAAYFDMQLTWLLTIFTQNT